MATTTPLALDAMNGRVQTTIATKAPAIVGIVPAIHFLGRQLQSVPKPDQFYLEVHNIAGNAGQSGFGVASRLFTLTGTLYAKVFAPMARANSHRNGLLLADELKKSFREREQGGIVWYRNARVVELMPERGFYRFNFQVDYTYDERQ